MNPDRTSLIRGLKGGYSDNEETEGGVVLFQLVKMGLCARVRRTKVRFLVNLSIKKRRRGFLFFYLLILFCHLNMI